MRKKEKKDTVGSSIHGGSNAVSRSKPDFLEQGRSHTPDTREFGTRSVIAGDKVQARRGVVGGGGRGNEGGGVAGGRG